MAPDKVGLVSQEALRDQLKYFGNKLADATDSRRGVRCQGRHEQRSPVATAGPQVVIDTGRGYKEQRPEEDLDNLQSQLGVPWCSSRRRSTARQVLRCSATCWAWRVRKTGWATARNAYDS